MKITIKTTNTRLTKEIRQALEEKIGTLDKFITNVSVPLLAAIEIAEDSNKRQGKNYYVEVNIQVPGKVLRSQVWEDNVFKAINQVKDKLQVILKKYNETQIIKRK